MIYDNIKAICVSQGISIRELERKASLGNGTIARWTDSTPSVKNLSRVAEILNVTIEALLK